MCPDQALDAEPSYKARIGPEGIKGMNSVLVIGPGRLSV